MVKKKQLEQYSPSLQFFYLLEAGRIHGLCQDYGPGGCPQPSWLVEGTAAWGMDEPAPRLTTPSVPSQGQHQTTRSPSARRGGGGSLCLAQRGFTLWTRWRTMCLTVLCLLSRGWVPAWAGPEKLQSLVTRCGELALAAWGSGEWGCRVCHRGGRQAFCGTDRFQSFSY